MRATPHESLKEKLHHPWVGGGVGGAFLALAGVALLIFSFGLGLAHWSYDLSQQLAGGTTVDDVVIVELQQDSFKALKQAPASYDRALHAQLITRLKELGARLIVFDIEFIDERPGQLASDQKLAAALRAAGNVVLSADLHSDTRLGSVNHTLTPPLDSLREAALGFGLATVSQDADRSVREQYPGLSETPGLGWKAAELAGAEVTRRAEARFEERWLNYYAPNPFRTCAVVDVLSNNLPANFSFSNKVVFIGAGKTAGYAGDEKEEVRTPWTRTGGAWALGVQVHALTFANLQRGDWFRRWPGLIEALLIAGAGLSLGLGVSRLRPAGATALALGVALAATAVSLLLAARFNTWFPWLIIAGVQVPVALGWSFFLHSMRAYVEAKVLQSSLELYLSPQQVKQILKTPALLKPGATQKTVSILFSDIAGFSKISERMDPDDLVKLLNQYYETAISCVHQTDGTVMNLIGDAIFAIWNAPQEQADHHERACRAALLLNEALVKFESASLSLPLRTRVGLHTGVVCVGNIGSSKRFDYTAIGESVNLASRLEGLNKQLGTNILATREIQKTAGDRLVSRLVGHFKFKGFDQVVEVHEMIGTVEIEEATRAWRQSFAAALRCFQRKSFDEAEDGFRKTLELHPADGPSQFYLERLPALKANAPASDWLGEVDLREK